MTDTDIHSCGYYCDRPLCIKSQRDELRNKMFSEQAVKTYEPVIDKSMAKRIATQLGWEPKRESVYCGCGDEIVGGDGARCGTCVAVKYKAKERVEFPTMLRKMWSGSEVQAWLDENVNKEKNT